MRAATKESERMGLSATLFQRLRHPLVRKPLFRIYDVILRRRAPRLSFDRSLGIDTRGFLPPHSLAVQAGDLKMTAYAGSMPSIVRHAIQQLTEIEAAHFIDIGAGKGRATAVASELPFRSITGVELSAELCVIARRHARRIRRLYPKRTPIRVIQADARRPPLPTVGKLVIFLYNPFGAGDLALLLEHLRTHAARQPIDVIYINPVHGELLDRDPGFHRSYAAQISYSAEEAASSEDKDDAIVTWSTAPSQAGRDSDRDRPIVVTKPGWRAELVPSDGEASIER